MSTAYYDERAEDFFRDTAFVDMTALHDRFLQYLAPGARILDAGCGSGRDSLAFARAGFHVKAFDGSAELVRLASASTGLPVVHMTFNEMTWEAAFEGVWACASLLHVSRSNLKQIGSRLVRSLVPNGIIFMSFKFGSFDREKDGRLFTDMTEQSLTTLSEELRIEVLDLWTSKDLRPGRESHDWVSVIGRRGCDPSP